MPHRLTMLAVSALLVAIDVYVIAQHPARPLLGDEWRYIYYATNLLHGFYSPRERVFLWNGPGYPLALMPFAKLGWIDGGRYANALYHVSAIVYAWLILRPRLRASWAPAVAGVLTTYAPLYEYLPLLYTEPLSFFLLTAWTYHALKVESHWRHVVAAGCLLAWLCLTKVIFGYVVAGFLLLAVVQWARRRGRLWLAHVRQAALALALCVPYLVYSYGLTGRVFYWSSGGAQSVYWLSSPYPHEWGDWYSQAWVQQNALLRAHHQEIFDRTTGLAVTPGLSVEEQVFNLSTPQAADIFAARAAQNIRQHPFHFARNWLANVVRLFLDVPVSVRGTPFWNQYSVCHLILLGWTALVVMRARRAHVPFPKEWLPIAVFGLLGLAAYSVVSSTGRFLIPFVPMWWLASWSWFARVTRE